MRLSQRSGGGGGRIPVVNAAPERDSERDRQRVRIERLCGGEKLGQAAAAGAAVHSQCTVCNEGCGGQEVERWDCGTIDELSVKLRARSRTYPR